ncbi:MAG: HD domain-containing protein [Patescibacteria group bacterium]|jgi:putative hydrolase of HD superfamily
MKTKTRTDKLLDFLKEIEKLKFIDRKVYLSDQKRYENDAEHSWHVAMFVLLFENDFPNLNIKKMLKMALIHDLVEIYAGDTFTFDEEGKRTKKDREYKAAKKLFGMLPRDLQKEFFNLMEEFEERKTREAIFTQSFDKLLPIIQNILSKGKAWKKYHITEKMAYDIKIPYLSFDKKILSIYKKLTAETKAKKLFGNDLNVR